jgi:hypothetical protein
VDERPKQKKVKQPEWETIDDPDNELNQGFYEDRPDRPLTEEELRQLNQDDDDYLDAMVDQQE